MRFSIAVAAILGGLQAASALKLSPRNAVEREEQVSTIFSVCYIDVATVPLCIQLLHAFLQYAREV